MKPHLAVTTEIYADSNARNWLAVRNCSLVPDKLGGFEVSFESELAMTEFCLRFAQYVKSCDQSTI